jgi:hypothetical protein
MKTNIQYTIQENKSISQNTINLISFALAISYKQYWRVN